MRKPGDFRLAIDIARERFDALFMAATSGMDAGVRDRIRPNQRREIVRAEIERRLEQEQQA